MLKLIINTNKEYLASQVNALLQNTRSKERQMEKLQMSAKEQIGMEVSNVSLPIVQSESNGYSKHILPNMVKGSIGDLELLKLFPQKMP